MHRRWALLGVAAVLGPGCGQEMASDRANGLPASAQQLAHADQVSREYLDAVARGDRARLCALRTEGAVSRWGGGAACERRAKGLLLGPYRHSTRRSLKMHLTQKGQAVDAGAAEVLPTDTSGRGDEARVVVDFGKALVENGHATGGEIIEIDLKQERGDYRVARVGFAAFAD
jgi:hypothetical protein